MDDAQAGQLGVRERRVGPDVAAVGSEIEGVPGNRSGRQRKQAETEKETHAPFICARARARRPSVAAIRPTASALGPDPALLNDGVPTMPPCDHASAAPAGGPPVPAARPPATALTL